MNKQFHAPAKPMREMELNKSAGILDDYAVRKNVATKEGTIEHVPTEDNHIVNKLYVDGQINNIRILEVSAGGSSSSTNPGTTVAKITATSGFKFINWNLFALQRAVASTQYRVIITYDDATQTIDDCAAGTASNTNGNKGGLIRHVSNVPIYTALSAKDVVDIEVQTLGTGIGTRSAIISAVEVTD